MIQHYNHAAMTVSAEDFRATLRLFASGVTVVAARAGDRVHGLTVSAFMSLSSDPPLVAVAIDRRHDAHDLLASPNAVFAVNLLADDQRHLSDRFAFEKEKDRFDGVAWSTAATGAPVLDDALAWIDCSISARHPAGSHILYVGAVEATRVTRPEDPPLVYWNRDYRRLAD